MLGCKQDHDETSAHRGPKAQGSENVGRDTKQPVGSCPLLYPGAVALLDSSGVFFFFTFQVKTLSEIEERQQSTNERKSRKEMQGGIKQPYVEGEPSRPMSSLKIVFVPESDLHTHTIACQALERKRWEVNSVKYLTNTTNNR